MADEDVKISVARIEQNIEHLSETSKEQKELLNNILLDSQKRNEAAMTSTIVAEVNRKRAEEQTEAIKYTITVVQQQIENLGNSVKSFKEEFNEKQNQLQVEMDSFNSKIDDNWLFVIKVIALVGVGALLGVGAMTSGLLKIITGG